MLKVTIFAGSEVRLRMDGTLYITVFGGCDATRPTLASQVATRRQQGESRLSVLPRPFFFTVFGGVDIKSPTLAEEYLDLRDLLSSGVMAADQCERAIAELNHADSQTSSFTLFGGFDECCVPSEDEEVEALALHRHLGNIPDAAAQVLQYGVGQRDAERYAAVRRAMYVETP